MSTELRRRLLEALALKDVSRSGWLRAGVEAPESVAAHSWGVAYLVLVLCPPELDRGRALAIALLHDLGEAKIGDITPHDGVSRGDKRRAETRAFRELTEAFHHHDELTSLWREYEDGTTAEGRFVKACDKLDMALQAQRYRSADVDTDEFITSALEVLDDALLRELAERRGDG